MIKMSETRRLVDGTAWQVDISRFQKQSLKTIGFAPRYLISATTNWATKEHVHQNNVWIEAPLTFFEYEITNDNLFLQLGYRKASSMI